MSMIETLNDVNNSFLSRREITCNIRGLAGKLKRSEAVDMITKEFNLDGKTVIAINLKNQTGSPLKKPGLIVFFCTCRLLFLYIYIYPKLPKAPQLLTAVHIIQNFLFHFKNTSNYCTFVVYGRRLLCTKEPIHTLKDEMLMLVDTSTPAI